MRGRTVPLNQKKWFPELYCFEKGQARREAWGQMMREMQTSPRFWVLVGTLFLPGLCISEGVRQWLGSLWPVCVGVTAILAIGCISRIRKLQRQSLCRRLVDLGLCSSCGYDLTGNTSGVCPECGTSTGDG